MSVQSAADTSPGSAPPTVAAPTRRRPFYWSLRRELWENRSIYIAPLVVAGVALLAFPFSLIGFPGRFLETSKLPLADQAAAHAEPYGGAAAAIILTCLVVGVFYCLGALQGERRDRSILFWKSLPVSDLTAVLAKATIPLAVLPVVAFGLVCATWLAMALISTAVLAAAGVDATPLWTTVPLASMAVVLLWGLFAMALWYAPLTAWLLAVSAWARRVAFLWAFGPPFVLLIFDAIAFRGHLFHPLVRDRLLGVFEAAFTAHTRLPMGLEDIDIAGFFASPGLWVGLIVAAALLAAAVWLRRGQGPS